MSIERKLANLVALLKVDYIMSNESERIHNPKRNDNKYNLLCETWQSCYELAEQYKGKISGQDPDFPCNCHLVNLVFPTENDEIILRETKAKLSNAIQNADEVNIDTDKKGNLRIYFGFEDVYTPREA